MLLIFDLDGTLLNTINDLGEACNHTLAAFHYPTHPLEDYPHLVGNGVNRLIFRALPEEARTKADIQEMRQTFVQYYDLNNTRHTHPYEGIPALLRQLKTDGHHLAVASNKYEQATLNLINHYFPQLFDCVMGETPARERKPAPDIVFDIIKQVYGSTRIPADDILYIGDSDVDIQTAKNAGVRMSAVSWGFVAYDKLLQLNPDYIVDNTGQLYQLILSLSKHNNQ